MRVKNGKCIWRMSFRSLWASRKRNLIAVAAIVLTTLLFTTLFTVALSINSSYETYNFRQIGGYSHGSFKDVTDEQAKAISAHPKVKEAGIRKVIGFCTEGVFAKVPAEVSFMDENTAKWSYAEPTTGHMPQEGMEIAMDTAALALLGVEPELGAEIPLTFLVGDKEQMGLEQTDTFILCGWWEYDSLMPVHYLNISEEYAAAIEAKGVERGMASFRSDLNVMMASSADIRGQMEQVDLDLGYDWETRDEPDSVRIGVNWGYTSSWISSGIDTEMVLAILAFILLVIFTGYLIIYNIFQISVTGDIRFYGLLKTIGTTPGQLRRIIRQQALLLCAAGIPVGMALGYGVGIVLTPVVLGSSTLGNMGATISVSPVIFIGSALFAIVTVLLSCAKPGRMAAKVSPVEAAKYTDAADMNRKRKSRNTRGAKVHQMAFANLGRNRKKTVLVVVSLSLAVVLLDILYTFVGSFDMEKYLAQNTCADFIVSSTDYFRFVSAGEYLQKETIEEIEQNTERAVSGCGYTLQGMHTAVWMQEETLREELLHYQSPEATDAYLAEKEHRGSLVRQDALIEGLEEGLLEKLTVVEGDLAPLYDENSRAIAVCVSTDDYGNYARERYPSIGDTQSVSYVTSYDYIDSRTGESVDEDTPEEYVELRVNDSREVDYTVCALVEVPYSMSYRYSGIGYETVLPVEVLEADSGQEAVPMFYLFDTPNEEAEAAAEAWLADFTGGELSGLMYESKATVRADFENFQNMFLMLGGMLCAVVGIVGVLNFINAIMTGVLSRRREFAVLQAVGMTNRQLEAMLVYEGLFYAAGSISLAIVLSLGLSPLVGSLMGDMFWFVSYHFKIAPVLLAIPVFLLLGWLIPAILYRRTATDSLVDRLRET